MVAPCQDKILHFCVPKAAPVSLWNWLGEFTASVMELCLVPLSVRRLAGYLCVYVCVCMCVCVFESVRVQKLEDYF